MGSAFNYIKDTWESVDKYMISLIKNNLDLIGASDFIGRFFESGRYMNKVEDQVISTNQNQLIKIGDTNGISSKDKELLSGTCSLTELKQQLQKKGGPFELMTQLKDILISYRDSILDGVDQASSTGLKGVMNLIQKLVQLPNSVFKCFLETLAEELGSIQFIIDGEAEYFVGAAFEIGISLDVGELLYLIANGHWQKSKTKIASVHVGWAIDCGAQAGGDLGFSIAYHTSGVTGVRQ